MKSILLPIKFLIAVLALVLHVCASAAPPPASATPPGKPTVVLVHGAFSESASWNLVARQLRARGYLVFAAANPLRGVQSDAIEAAHAAAMQP
jgi:alpha-beta hydrolase superfamily lysophospholipase